MIACSVSAEASPKGERTRRRESKGTKSASLMPGARPWRSQRRSLR